MTLLIVTLALCNSTGAESEAENNIFKGELHIPCEKLNKIGFLEEIKMRTWHRSR